MPCMIELLRHYTFQAEECFVFIVAMTVTGKEGMLQWMSSKMKESLADATWNSHVGTFGECFGKCRFSPIDAGLKQLCNSVVDHVYTGGERKEGSFQLGSDIYVRQIFHASSPCLENWWVYMRRSGIWCKTNYNLFRFLLICILHT